MRKQSYKYPNITFPFLIVSAILLVALGFGIFALNVVLAPHASPISSKIVSQPIDNIHSQISSIETSPPKPDFSPPTIQRSSYSENPHAISHPILFYSDDMFRDTPIDEMMKPYGQAMGDGTCSIDFGNSLVNKWRDQKRSYCSQRVNSVSDQSIATSSTIDCYLHHQTRHHGNGDNLCHMKNVAVRMSDFATSSITSPVIKEYVNSRHNNQPYIPYTSGFVTADCNPREELKDRSLFPGWNADWLTNGLKTGLHPSTDSHLLTCSKWIRHPVLIIQRDTFANFFHDSEDFVNAFLALAILRWQLKDTQIWLTDLYPEGPFWSIWNQSFSHGHPPLNAWQLGQLYGPSHPGSETRICFEDLTIGIYGPAAPITVASWNTPCSHTALVRAYSDFIIRGMGLQKKTHYFNSLTSSTSSSSSSSSSPSPSKTINITYMARRASSEWPEKLYCDDQHSFFLCEYWETFGIRKLGRMINNENDLINGLKSLEINPPLTLDGKLPHVVVTLVDYNLLTFREQIEIDLQTDIMIGPHGAGLMHNIFMRDRAALIELFVDGSGANRHFHNLAHWFGRYYEGIQQNNPVNVREVVDAARTAISKMKLSSY